MDNLVCEILKNFEDEDIAEIVISVERDKFIITLQQTNEVGITFIGVETEPKRTIQDGLHDILEFLNSGKL